MALISSQSAAAIPRPTASQEGKAMSLKRYDVEINGMLTTLQLSEEDAKLYGLKPSDAAKPAAKAAKPPANKARTASADKRAEAVSKSFGQKAKTESE